jgi:membrane associated rhomboid family serine protease
MSSGPVEPVGTSAGPRFCFRHGDRETYISCQRCMRPICPDCMRPASVGFHCPVCVAEAAKTVRQPRTMAGGLVPDKVGVLSWVIVGINVVLFLAAQATDELGQSWAVNQLAMLGDSAMIRGTGDSVVGVADGGYWRLLSAVFLHERIVHILFNMYALVIFGPMLEGALGRVRFLALYLTAGLAGSVLVYCLTAPNALTLGASGAIYGLFGATFAVFARRGLPLQGLLVLMGINIALTLLVPNISWQGHLGGLLAGLFLGWALAYAPRSRRTLVQASAFVAVYAVLVVAVVARTAQLA